MSISRLFDLSSGSEEAEFTREHKGSEKTNFRINKMFRNNSDELTKSDIFTNLPMKIWQETALT